MAEYKQKAENSSTDGKPHGSEKQKLVSAHLLRETFEDTFTRVDVPDEWIWPVRIRRDMVGYIMAMQESSRLLQEKILRVERRISLNGPYGGPDTACNVLRDSKLVKDEEHIVCPTSGYGLMYSGVTTSKDGQVILTNLFEHRAHVCLYNPTTRSMQGLRLDAYSCSVTQIDDAHLVISTPRDIYQNNFLIVEIFENGLGVEKTLQKLQIQYNPVCIVALKNGLLAVAWDRPPAFGVINVKWNNIVHISYMDRDAKGRRFNYFEYMAVDEERQRVIQPCIQDEAVYCFDLMGRPFFKYTHPELTNPRGVALDKCGNIYVCEHSSPGGIHKVSPCGEPISVMTEGIPSYPLAICSDDTGDAFWVTYLQVSVSRDEHKIMHFRLQKNTY